MRKLLLIVAAVSLAAAAGYGWLWQRAYGPWTEWEAYADHFVQPDGRVVDITAGSRTTSEGQAYSLFFALVANDQVRFQHILGWTRDNLCEGDFAKRLPAWLWGQRADGSWGVLDDNAASDADLWMVYTLQQAGRIWQNPALSESARVLLWQVRSQELVDIGQAGLLLLPAPRGFGPKDGRWRLNPSYYAGFQFAALAAMDPEGPWKQIWANFGRLMPQVASAGYAPDWFLVDEAGKVFPDETSPDVGSYDAIRVYLWAGMSDAASTAPYAPFANVIGKLGAPPETIDVRTGVAGEAQPIGFSAAVLPFLKGLGESKTVDLQQKRLRDHRVEKLLGRPAHYYDQVLALFGEGWSSKRFRFGTDGRVTLRWESLWPAL